MNKLIYNIQILFRYSNNRKSVEQQHVFPLEIPKWRIALQEKVGVQSGTGRWSFRGWREKISVTEMPAKALSSFPHPNLPHWSSNYHTGKEAYRVKKMLYLLLLVTPLPARSMHSISALHTICWQRIGLGSHFCTCTNVYFPQDRCLEQSQS